MKNTRSMRKLGAVAKPNGFFLPNGEKLSGRTLTEEFIKEWNESAELLTEIGEETQAVVEPKQIVESKKKKANK